MHTWDQQYKSGEYVQRWDYAYPSQELIALVATLASTPGRTSLDVGCGSGREAIFLAQAGFQSIGVDFSREALNIAKQRAKDAKVSVQWIHSDVLQLPLASNSVFFINDRGCYHNLELQDRLRYATEMARVLQPNGMLFLRGGLNPDDVTVPVTEKDIRTHFSTQDFDFSPIFPIVLISDGGTLQANLVILRRQQK